MAKLTLEEIKAKADEYAKTVRQLKRAQDACEREKSPVTEKYEKAISKIDEAHSRKIGRLLAKAEELKAEVLAFVADKKKTYEAESEHAVFGVKVGTKELERQPDKAKLWDLCKKKSVEFFDLISVSLGAADKALGKKEVDAISTRKKKETRLEYVGLKD